VWRFQSFAWGLRGLTERGWRSYAWEKMATARVPLPRSFRITFESTRTTTRRRFAWWEGSTAGLEGTPREEPKSQGAFTTQLRREPGCDEEETRAGCTRCGVAHLW
jgi:hypothetical protein